MSDDTNASEKEFDPTDRKLEQARERGDVPRSQEVGAALGLMILTAVITSRAVFIAEPMRDSLRKLWSIDALEMVQSGQSIIPLVVPDLARALLPLLGAMAATMLLFQLIEMGFTLPSGEDAGLKLDFNKLNVVANAKEKFGLKVVLDSFKNVLKLLLVSSVMVYSALDVFDRIPGMLLLNPTGVAMAVADFAGEALFRISLVAILIALIDIRFERFRYMRKQRMSRQDIKDEMKQSEGDPLVKQQQRKRALDIATKERLATVPEATVLVANPTHFSVTLRYDRERDGAPMVLGKGRNRLALRMREEARKHGVPIVENKPLARALYAVGEEGKPIPLDFYRAVAEVLAYVLAPPGSRALPPAPAEIPESARAAVQRLGVDL